MKKVIINLLIIVLLVSNVSAQIKSETYTVFFNVDESNLDKEDFFKLDKIKAELKKYNYYEINITAHTDIHASDLYNELLSKKRAVSVKDYFLESNIPSNCMQLNWHGEYKPIASNSSEEGRAKNRRVDITITTFNLKNSNDLVKQICPEYKQVYTVNPLQKTVVTSKNGMRIEIPENAFQTLDGKDILTNEVEIELEEYHRPMDFVLNNLSTVSNGKILESGGMFKINAKSKNQELTLKKGKTIEVEMPSKNIQNNMSVFTGTRTTQGVVEWQIQEEKFKLKNKDIKPIECTIILDEKELKKMYQDSDEGEKKLQFKYQYPSPVYKPKMPKKPKKILYPSNNEMFTFIESITLTKAEKVEITKKEYHRIDSINEKKNLIYSKRLASYQEKINSYPSDSLKYLKANEEYKSWINKEIEILMYNIMTVEKKAFNRNLVKLVQYNRNKKVNCKNLPNFFKKSNCINSKEQESIQKYRTYVYCLLEIKNSEKTVKKYFKDGMVNYSNPKLYLKTFSKFREIDFDLSNTLLKESKENTYLIRAMKSAELDKVKTTGIQANSLAQNANTIYSTSLQNLGYINCDRFINQELVDIEIEAPEGMQINLYVKSVNGMMFAGYNENTKKYTAKVPKNEKIQLLVIGVIEGMPVFDNQQITLEQKMLFKSQPKITSTLDIINKMLQV